jgi:hypothetical protein
MLARAAEGQVMVGALRLARGLAIGIAIVSASAIGHAAAGGAAHLESTSFVVLALLSMLAGVLVSARALSWSRLLALLGSAQVVVHVAVSGSMADVAALAAPSRSGAGAAVDVITAAGAGVSAGMGMSAGTVEMPPMGGAGHVMATSTSSGVVMLLAHVVAVLVLSALIQRGEAWAAVVQSRLGAALHPWIAVAVRLPDVGSVRSTWTLVPAPVRPAPLAHPVSRRGPPT